MTEDALFRFKIATTDVRLGQFAYTNKTVRWGVYGHPKRFPHKWTRIAARDTENEVRNFCEHWGLNIGKGEQET